MNHSFQKCFRTSPGLIVLLCCAAVILSSCSKKPSKALIGNWQVQGQSAQVEFRKDGTLASTERGHTQTGTYKFTDDTHLQMEINTGNTNIQGQATITVACELAMHDDAADLTMTMPGSAQNQKEIAHLKRIK